MRRVVLIIAACSALAVAGVAVGKGIATQAVRQVGATFAATSIANTSARTCTTADGTFVVTRAVYTGTATSSEPSLSGAIRLNVQSLINTTKNLGVVTGRLRIDTASERDTSVRIDAVYANGQVHGLASGRTTEPATQLLADLSSSFSVTGGFTNGKLGGTDGGGAAIELLRGSCKPAPKPVSQRVRARGTVSAVSAGSITVAGVTCAVPSTMAQKLSGLAVGDVAEIRCELVGNQQTLTKIDRKGRKNDDD